MAPACLGRTWNLVRHSKSAINMRVKVLGSRTMCLIDVFLTREAIVVHLMAFPKLLLTNTTSTAAYLEQELRENNSFVGRMC